MTSAENQYIIRAVCRLSATFLAVAAQFVIKSLCCEVTVRSQYKNQYLKYI
jgi:hypothetical protein